MYVARKVVLYGLGQLMYCQIPSGCCDKDYETCDDTGCYAAGATCCTGYACLGTENCLDGKCCPKNAQTCEGTGCWIEGAVCCSDSSAKVCDSDEACCPNGCMPADSGNTCCGQKYCTEGSFCCSGETRCCPDEWQCCGDTCMRKISLPWQIADA